MLDRCANRLHHDVVMLTPEPACLVIADISGYTRYLAGAELDHAQDILADLMSTVVTSVRPTFRLAKLEGGDAIIEEVLDWQPNDHVTYRSLLPAPGVPKLVNTFAFEDLDDGRTRMTARFARPRSAKDRAIAEGLVPMLDDTVGRGLAALTALLAARSNAAADADAPAEPDLPVSRGRNLSDPVGWLSPAR